MAITSAIPQGYKSIAKDLVAELTVGHVPAPSSVTAITRVVLNMIEEPVSE